MTLNIDTIPTPIKSRRYLLTTDPINKLTTDPINKRNRPKALGQYRYMPPKLRTKILDRDNHICQMCGKPGETVDHIIPWRISRDNSESNLRCLCSDCNLRRRLERRDARPKAEDYEAYLRNELQGEG